MKALVFSPFPVCLAHFCNMARSKQHHKTNSDKNLSPVVGHKRKCHVSESKNHSNNARFGRKRLRMNGK